MTPFPLLEFLLLALLSRRPVAWLVIGVATVVALMALHDFAVRKMAGAHVPSVQYVGGTR